MTIKYWRSEAGAYLGATNGASPLGAIEVAAPPADARATWTGTGWEEPPPPRALVPLGTVLFRIVAGGHLPPMLAVLQAEPQAAALLLTLREGIYADDAQAAALLALAGADPAVILAP